MSRGQRNMAIFDKWQPDNEHRCCCIESKVVELDLDITHWPQQVEDGSLLTYLLRLEEMNQFDVDERIRSRNRNLVRVNLAKERKNILHLDVHYTCCTDPRLRNSIEALVKHDNRKWCSFTMLGINGMEDFYATSAVTENLHSFFTTLRDFQVLNLHSCILNRGHGLECILKSIPNFSRLEALRLEGWQMDRITVEALVDSLRLQYTKSIKYLSLRSNLFIGEDSFAVATECLQHIPHLETLNISYCSLGDDAVVLLIERLQLHPKMTRVHLGGNFCHSQRSVDAISNWIQQPSCNLQDLNLRSLWVGFTEEGLVQRFVDLVPLFQALSENGSICNLSLSENYLEDKEVLQLSKALLSRQKQDLRCLDVGDNPFEQKGAECLIDLVSNTRSLHHIRFENHYMQFQSGEFIKLLVEFNYYDKVLVDKSAHIPLSLWPKALAKVQEQQNQEENALGESRVPNHLFRLLRSSTGPFGHELSLQIALHSSKSPI